MQHRKITTPRHFIHFEYSQFKDPHSAFNAILANAPYVPDGGTPKLHKAFEVAQGIFKGETRKDGVTPAISHTLAVTYYILVLLGGRESAGCTGLLHDIEDGVKYDLPIGYQYVKKWFGPNIATDVEYLTIPKCIGENPDGSHVWITSSDHRYAYTKDLFYQKEMPLEVYKEMRKFYIERMLCARGIRAFCEKLCDAMSNLRDIENLPPDRRARKLEENMLLVELAARLHWKLYELMSESLKFWNYPVPDLTKAIQEQEKEGFVVLPPRAMLDPQMVRELPIRHPNSSVISIYSHVDGVHDGTIPLEIGIPYDAHELRAFLSDTFEPKGLRFTSTPSLLSRCFNMDARERIYAVNGLSKNTPEQTQAAVEDFVIELITKLKT